MHNLMHFEKNILVPGAQHWNLVFSLHTKGSAPNTSAELSTPGSASKFTLTLHSTPCSAPGAQRQNSTLELSTTNVTSRPIFPDNNIYKKDNNML